MSWRTPDDKFRKPKEVDPPSLNEIFKNQKHWKNKTITYLGDKKYFDQDVRTGVCYFCNKEGRTQKSKTTFLHHAKYDHSDPLAWTIEICGSCHWQIDERNREAIAKRTGKEINQRPQPFYENKEQKRERAERDKVDWYKSFCWNIGGKFTPNKRLIPDRETFDKVIEAIKQAAPKKDTMSDVSQRYF